MRTHLVRSCLAAVAALALSACSGADGDTTARDAAARTPPVSVLADGTRMGAVELRTGDLDGLAAFYTAGVGLVELDRTDASVTLGVGTSELLRLVGSDLPADDPTEAGLYHSAFLFPDEPALAEAIARTVTVAPDSFQGSADHRVSQAFYFGDPEGNGVELYVDRPAAGWQWRDGLVTMGSAELDPQRFLTAHLEGEPPASAAAVSMGHVHLRGGDLDEAESFYADTLGFSVTSRVEGARFFSAGGYHHHLAVNTWSSAGAGARPGLRGIGVVTVVVPDADELAAVESRLRVAGVAAERDGDALSLADPWGTPLRIEVDARV